MADRRRSCIWRISRRQRNDEATGADFCAHIRTTAEIVDKYELAESANAEMPSFCARCDHSLSRPIDHFNSISILFCPVFTVYVSCGELRFWYSAGIGNQPLIGGRGGGGSCPSRMIAC